MNEQKTRRKIKRNRGKDNDALRNAFLLKGTSISTQKTQLCGKNADRPFNIFPII